MVESFSPNGDVMEMLSEYIVEDRREGYLLSGRHRLMSCYEPFMRVNDSMFDQHAKWCAKCNKLSWRAPISSLNLLITVLFRITVASARESSKSLADHLSAVWNQRT